MGPARLLYSDERKLSQKIEPAGEGEGAEDGGEHHRTGGQGAFMSHAAGHAEAAHGGGGGQHDEHADQQLAPAAHQDGNGKEDGGEKDELESAAHQGEPEAAGGLFEVDAGAQCDKSKRGGGGGKAGDSPLEDDRLRDAQHRPEEPCEDSQDDGIGNDAPQFSGPVARPLGRAG